MAGLIDKEEEENRLTREIDKIGKEAERIEAKLANPNFVERAPEEVVGKEREKLAEMQSALSNLQEQLERIKKM
jgi:valyl-tRNA synthetase